MNTKKKVLNIIKEKKEATGKELSEILGVSRQAVNSHLKALIQAGEVIKEGVTRGAIYKPASVKDQGKKILKKIYRVAGLEEDRVFQEISCRLHLKTELVSPAYDIVAYAFTELLNNAIDHSQSETCNIEFTIDQYALKFRIRDFGIGVFHSISKKFGLPSEDAAILELLKGKTTTMKERHSGEGIFFTSRSADELSLRSHTTALIFNNIKNDVFIEKKRMLQGTQADFSISKRATRKLDKLFSAYAPEEYEHRFEKTAVFVKLHAKEYVSRSEAKRLLMNLDKFREVVLDFKGVKSLGQGFADEIFRVFKNQHPEISIKTANLDTSLEMMISHVLDNRI